MTRVLSPSGGAAKLLVLALSAATLALPVAASAAPGGTAGSGGASANGTAEASTNATVPVCLPEQAGFASCDAVRLTDPSRWQGSRGGGGGGGGSTAPAGYGASDLEKAYGVYGKSAPTGTTVAIVDAYADPTVASDLGTYRAKMGLPALCGAGASSGCSGSFTVVTPQGAPVGNTGWGQEISLDVDMVSAFCPNCNIVLEEAASNSYADLGGAVNDAVIVRHAVAVSNSYGGTDSSSDSSFDAAYYNHPGVAVTASSGDNGYGVEYPAASPDVIAVGGTHLSSVSGPETVWSGAGSGCSSYEPPPSWQTYRTSTWCPGGREVADVSADADPNTGVAVYDTYGQSGWLVFGGTSVASPIIASVFALATSNSSLPLYPAATLYSASGTSAFHLVTSGTNARRCPTGDYLCNAFNSITGPAAGPWTTSTDGTPVPGNVWYNGPTGNGTPNGLGAF